MNLWRIHAQLLPLMLLSLSGCCNKSLPRVENWQNRTLGSYAFLLQNVTVGADSIDSSLATNTKGHPFESPLFKGYISVPRYGFWLDLTNASDKPITLLWSETRYVDEFGEAHQVYQQPMGALPDDRNALTVTKPQVAGSNERVHVVIVPLYKQYQVGFGCRGELPHSEPLIPTNLRELSEEEATAHVRKVFEEQSPVKFILPLEIEGERYDYIFSFTLHDWRSGLPAGTPEELRELEKRDKESSPEAQHGSID